jgi:hypothetical protein
MIYLYYTYLLIFTNYVKYEILVVYGSIYLLLLLNKNNLILLSGGGGGR